MLKTKSFHHDLSENIGFPFYPTYNSMLLGSLYSLDSNLQYFSTVCRPGLYSATSLSSSQSFSERLTLSLMGVFIFICTSKSSWHNFLMQFLPNDLKPRNFSSYNQKELPHITLRVKSLRSSILVIPCPLSLHLYNVIIQEDRRAFVRRMSLLMNPSKKNI